MPENNLNLPKTSFSMKANLPSKEPKIQTDKDKGKDKTLRKIEKKI